MVFGLKKKAFSGNEGRFFELLTRQSAKTLEGLEALWNFARMRDQGKGQSRPEHRTGGG